jgi:signal transduction histidine kinase
MRMNGRAVPVTSPPEPGPRRGVRGGLRTAPLAPLRAMTLFGLTLAGAVLFVLAVGPVVLGVLLLGQSAEDMMGHGFSTPSDGRRDLLVVLPALACCCRFVLPATLLAARRLTMLTRRLLARWCGVTIRPAYQPPPQTPPPGKRSPGTLSGRPPGTVRLGYRQRMTWLLGDPATWRDLLWLLVNTVVGSVLLLGPIALAVGGASASLAINLNGLDRTAGGVLVVLALGSAPWTLRAYANLARQVLAPSEQAELELRVAYLAQTRQESLDTGAAELRRIERDLHDGAQARLVAMGLTLDAAGRLIDTDQAAARALLIEARDASAKALAELRDLVRGVHPPVLADRGLADAVRALALDAPVRVQVTGALDGRPPAPVESAAYFAVSELLANVAKHAGARSAEIDLRHAGGALRISVRDDGAGGADPARGTGLGGVERRLAAFDGVLAISSPAGGPTVITMEVPCPLPAPCALEVPCASS